MHYPGKLISFVQLIRWKNLIITALTMVLMRYAILEPLMSRTGVMLINDTNVAVPVSLQMPWYDFAALVMAVVLITAAGYVINDYFDIKTDLINKGRVIVGTKISRRQTILWHSVFNTIGVAAGIYVSFRAGYIWFGLLFIFVSGLLYFYSASYKREFLIGNIIVSLLTALVPFMVIVFEWPALEKYYSENAVSVPDLSFLTWWIAGFSFFAFISTLIRELIKDIEDFEGDKAFGRNTLPIVLGVKTTKSIVVVLLLLFIASMYLVWYFFLNDTVTLIYISAALAAPLLFNIFYLSGAVSRRRLHLSSSLMKIVMLSGLMYSIVVWIIITYNYI